MKTSSLILYYNHIVGLPFLLSDSFSTGKWRVTLDQSLLIKADVVIFHLPTFLNSSPDEIEKREGQIWVGWRHGNEPIIEEEVSSIWDKAFDFEISYSPECYWECATTHGNQAHLVSNIHQLPEGIARWWRKVDFMLLGTQKGGSTALHEYLHQHPSCWGALYKEPGFFLFPHIYATGFSWYIGHLWKECPPLRYSLSDNLLFESTSWYSYWHEVPQRLYEYNPDLKLIFLVRNPVDRAFSQYNMLIGWNKEQLMYEYTLYPDKKKLNVLMDQLLDTDHYPFSYWVDLELEKIRLGSVNPSDFFPDFLHRGLYCEQLERYYQYFSKEQILVIESGELKKSRIPTLQKIENFLGIYAIHWGEKDLEDRFVTQYHGQLNADLRRKMIKFFDVHNKRLFQMIGKSFDWR